MFCCLCESVVEMEQILRDKYKILRSLGQGGMGEVLLVMDMHLQRPAAAKRIRVIQSGQERQEAEEFRREMEFLKELEHPGLPAVYDFFKEQEWLYLIMEYAEGITLEQYLKKNGKVEVSQAVPWIVELTEVLEYLHSRRPAVLYRDLKPANIIIRPGGDLKLIDLGACVQSFGMRGGAMGTPGYAAPEQWQMGQVSETCDIYALGAVFHEMLTGILPGGAGYERRPVREYDGSLPAGLEKIILKCTDPNPDNRYRSMECVREELLKKSWQEKIRKILQNVGTLISIFLWISTAVNLGYPLIQGVPETKIPFPYLYRPAFTAVCAVLFQRIVLHRKKKCIKKIEKSILATEKKFDGL